MRKALLLLFISISVAISAQNSVRNYISKGYKLFGNGEVDEACHYFKQAVELDPQNYYARFSWAGTLSQLAQTNNSDRLYKESFAQFKKATQIDKNQFHAYNDWGVALMYYAKSKNKLYTYSPRIKELYEKGIEVGSQSGAYNMACLYSLLNEKEQAMLWLRKTVNEDCSLKMEKLDREKLENDPDFDNIRDSYEFIRFMLDNFYTRAELIELNNQFKEDYDTAIELMGQERFAEAVPYFEKRIKYAPETYNSRILLGSVLSELGQERNDKTLYKTAIKNFKEAYKIAPHKPHVYNNWGVALSRYAVATNKVYTYAPRIRELYDKSIELTNSQTTAYNIACLYSLLNDKEGAMMWLYRMADDVYKKDMGNFTREKFDKDPDFDNIRHLPEFEQYLESNFGWEPESEVNHFVEELNNDFFTAYNLVLDKDYQASYPYFEKLAVFLPNNYDVFQVWGLALSDEARETNNLELYEASFDKFYRAIEINSNRSAAYNNLGVALTYYSLLNNDLQSHSAQIKELFEIPLDVGEQLGAYNIGCLYALLNDKENAMTWLYKTVEDEYEITMDDLDRQHIKENSDFDNIRHTKEFESFLNKHFPIK